MLNEIKVGICKECERRLSVFFENDKELAKELLREKLLNKSGICPVCEARLAGKEPDGRVVEVNSYMGKHGIEVKSKTGNTKENSLMGKY